MRYNYWTIILWLIILDIDGGTAYAHATDTFGILLENLIDAGCDDETISKCMTLAKNNQWIDCIPILTAANSGEIRSAVLIIHGENVHSCYSEIIFTERSEGKMKVLVLNGSPRPSGNTAKMIAAFKEGAEQSGHEVNVIDVCRKNIKGCLACEYCHGKGNGKCVQKDDMQEVYDLLKAAEMLLIASPIYYHGLSGQIKCVIDRFYSAAYPIGPKNLSKIGMILCSGDRDQYAGARFSYDGDFLGYLNLEDKGFLTVHGGVTKQNLEDARKLGASL